MWSILQKSVKTELLEVVLGISIKKAFTRWNFPVTIHSESFVLAGFIDFFVRMLSRRIIRSYFVESSNLQFVIRGMRQNSIPLSLRMQTTWSWWSVENSYKVMKLRGHNRQTTFLMRVLVSLLSCKNYITFWCDVG